MKHGLVQNETFAGSTLMVPPSRTFYKKIGLPVYATYRFVGYKTSILRHLIDCGEEIVNGSSDDGFTVQVRVNNVAKSATDQYMDQIRGAAFGAAGETVAAINTIGTVLDSVSVAGMVGDMLPEGGKKKLKRPGAIAYQKDHMMNGRLIVDISMQSGMRSGWTDTGEQQITLKDVAYIVNDF